MLHDNLKKIGLLRYESDMDEKVLAMVQDADPGKARDSGDYIAVVAQSSQMGWQWKKIEGEFLARIGDGEQRS